MELVWDPMSHQQSVSLSGVCHRLEEDYSIFKGEQSKPVKVKPTLSHCCFLGCAFFNVSNVYACSIKGFIEAVIQRLRNCVDEDVFIPLYPKK